MASLTDQIVILHIRPFRDSSLILDTFSKHHGRIPLVAKGARAQSRRSERAGLQMSSVLEATISGRSELKSLNQFDVIRPPSVFVGEEFAIASYISELVLRVTQSWDAMPEVFEGIIEAFEHIKSPRLKYLSLRRLEWSLIQALGTAIDFDYDAMGQAIKPEQNYELKVDEGFIAIENDSQCTTYYTGHCLAQIASGHWDSPDVLSALKRINQTLLVPYLGNLPLKSRELWLQWRRRH